MNPDLYMKSDPFVSQFEDALLQNLAQPEGSDEKEEAKLNVFELEIGYRAWTWAQDVNEFEENDEYEVREMIAGLTGAYYLEGV